MLAEHRIDDANERFVTIEYSMAARQQIAFQPALALMLAQHGIHYTPGGRQELIVLLLARMPLAVGHLEYGAQEVG